MTAFLVLLVLLAAFALVWLGYELRGRELAATDPRAPGGHDVSIGYEDDGLRYVTGTFVAQPPERARAATRLLQPGWLTRHARRRRP